MYKRSMLPNQEKLFCTHLTLVKFTITMKAFSSLLLGSLFLASLEDVSVLARPSPQPKSAWVRQGKGRKHMMDTIVGRSTPRRSCGEGACTDDAAAKSASSPKENVWDGLTGPEAASVTEWLFKQPELNLTTTEESIGDWDNTM